jgi:hypothetical protein
MKKFILLILRFLRFPVPAWVYADDSLDQGDYKIAFEKIYSLAKKGHADAQFKLGVMYEVGQSVPQNYEEAFEFYRMSAEQGHANAQNSLGWMYENGFGVPKNCKEAVKWYRLSADQGMDKAQYNLGIMYGKGLGVIQDHVEAHKWFNLVGINGDEDGRKNMEKIEKLMTPEQIAEAQRLAKEWMERHPQK